MVDSINELVNLYPVTDGIVQEVDSIKHEYYRDQLSFPDMQQFLSFNSSCFINATYPLRLHDMTSLHDYVAFFLSHPDRLLTYTPPFDRPILPVQSYRDTMSFIPPSLHSPSFLSFPVSQLLNVPMKDIGWDLDSQDDSDDITLDGTRRDFDDTDNGEDSPFPAGESDKNVREDTSLFVKESVRRLCQQRDEAAAKRLCASVARLWEEGRVEESVGEGER